MYRGRQYKEKDVVLYTMIGLVVFSWFFVGKLAAIITGIICVMWYATLNLNSDAIFGKTLSVVLIDLAVNIVLVLLAIPTEVFSTESGGEDTLLGLVGWLAGVLVKGVGKLLSFILIEQSWWTVVTIGITIGIKIFLYGYIYKHFLRPNKDRRVQR